MGHTTKSRFIPDSCKRCGKPIGYRARQYMGKDIYGNPQFVHLNCKLKGLSK